MVRRAKPERVARRPCRGGGVHRRRGPVEASNAHLGRRIAGIRYGHRLAGLAAVMRGARRTLGVAPVKKAAATSDRFLAMVVGGKPNLAGKLDRAPRLTGVAPAPRQVRSPHFSTIMEEPASIPDANDVNLLARGRTGRRALYHHGDGCSRETGRQCGRPWLRPGPTSVDCPVPFFYFCARASIAASTFGGDIGNSVSRTPTARSIALAMAAIGGQMLTSATPLAPYG
jgi:hypothetical protein